MFRRLIAGFDGGSSGRDALALAAVLGGSPDADVLAVGVYPDPLMPFPPVLNQHASQHEDCERQLRAARDELAPRARTHAIPAVSPSRALWHAVSHEHADILVLGSARGTSQGQVRAGRHARQLLHDSPCAIAIAPAGFAEHPRAIRRILVGIDGSPESGDALDLGRTLAGATRAGVRVVTAIDPVPPAAPTQLDVMGIPPTDWDAVVEQRRVRARELLDDAVGADDAIQTAVLESEPAKALCEASRDSDLLVIGSRHWGPFARIVLGGTGEQVVRHAHCAVLMVPRGEVEPETPVEALASRATV
jgi:nucleotide-binding universal stress UspA family protein